MTEETGPIFSYNDDKNYFIVAVGFIIGFNLALYGAFNNYRSLVGMSVAFILALLGHLFFIRNKHHDSYKEMRKFIQSVDERRELDKTKVSEIKSAFGVEDTE